MRGVEYSELLVFVQVAQAKSFRRAAVQLAQSPSSISHTIRSLENRLGSKLLNRTTRSVSPTEAGQMLLDRIAPAFTEINSAIANVSDSRDRPAGTVRINVPSAAAELVVTPLLSDFARTHPAIRLEITVEDSFVDIVEGGFDVGIRPGEHLHRDMIGMRLTSDLPLAIVCAPNYLEGRSTPLTPRDLREHACLMYRFATSRHVYAWPLKRQSERLDFLVDGIITTNDLGMIVSSCLAGAGIACLMEPMVDPYVKNGKLVRLLQDWCEPFSGFFLYYSSRQMSAAVRAFVDFLQTRKPPAPNEQLENASTDSNQFAGLTDRSAEGLA